MNPIPLKSKLTLWRALAVILFACIAGREARAEISLSNVGGFEAFTDGRVGGFVTYHRGDGYPPDTFLPDPNDPTMKFRAQVPFGGGINANTANPIGDAAVGQPKLEGTRVRSGLLGNIFGFGIRSHINEATSITGYIQFWSDIESESRRKYVPAPVDVRQGFVRIEGYWGSFQVGRQLTLFSRGAAEIDFLYGHGYGVGFPTAVDSNGTAAGHVGTGVLGPGFAGGVIYATPSLAGLRLSAAIFDPVALQGAWDRTKWVRPEAELTFDRVIQGVGLIHLFANGGYQKVYRIGEPDSTSESAYGAGYGGRLEVGPVHFGVAGHYGQGLGLYYALETTEAAYDATPRHRLRKSDGYYAQLQVVLGKFDVNAGAGIARVTPLGQETVTISGVPTVLPADGAPDASNLRQSLIKHQTGLSAAIVYHVTRSLHLDIDYFRAQFAWQLGEHQNVNFLNTGVVMTW